MWLRMFSLVAFVSLVAGCTSVGGDGDGLRSDGSEFKCPRGLTRPFSVKTLIRVAQRNGVSLKRDPSCGAILDAVEAASNIVIGDSVREDNAVDAREGHVICQLEDLPFAEPTFRVRRTKHPSDQETYFDVANVNCAIFPSAKGQIAKLQAALEAFARAPVDQGSCPKTRGEPVTVERLIEAAKTNGVRLLVDARCIEPGVVAQASTIVPYDRPENYDKVWYAQGQVTCLVRDSADRRAKTIRTTALTVGKRFDLLNVSCTIKPYPENEAAQVARLRATLKDLQ